jgi:hypothetical protein
MTLFHNEKEYRFRESRGKDLSWDMYFKGKNLIKEDRF